MKKLLAILCTLTTTAIHAQQSWQYVGQPNFTAPSGNYDDMCFGSQGQCYIAFPDGAVSNYMSVMTYDGTNWVYVGNPGFTPYGVSYCSIAIDENDTLYACFNNMQMVNSLCVMKFNGTSWVYVGSPGFSPNFAAYPTIEIDTLGKPWVAFSDAGNGNRTSVMRFTGTNWVYVGTPGFSVGTSSWHSLIWLNGSPCVGYSDQGDNDYGYVKKFNGSNWVTLGGVPYANVYSSNNELAKNSGDTLFVIYQDQFASPVATVKMFDGASWDTVGTAGFSNTNCSWTELDIDANGVLYASYRDDNDTGRCTVQKFENGTWSIVGQPSFTGTYTYCPLLEVSPAGVPYLMYWKASRFSVMKFDSCAVTSSIITTNSCFNYLSPAGNTYTLSGIYHDTLINAIGCDSIITINLTIDTVDINVMMSGATLTSTATGAIYQWFDCATMQNVNGETSQSFSPAQNGNYAVAITQNGCMDTSACINVLNVGLQEDANFDFYLSPSITNSSLMISLEGSNSGITIQIVDVYGRIIHVPVFAESTGKFSCDVSGLSEGIYFVRVSSGSGNSMKPFIKSQPAY